MVLLDKVKRNLSIFFVGHLFRNESIGNCLFSLRRRLPISAECSADMLSWLLPLINIVQGMAKIGSVSAFTSIIPSISYALPLMGIIFHAMTSMILHWSCSVHLNQSRLDSRFIYLANPIVFASSLMSPVPSLLHLLISFASFSALKGWSFQLCVCLGLLMMGHFEFICVIPAYLILLRRATDNDPKASLGQKSTITYSVSIAQHCCRAAIGLLVLYLVLIACCECFDLFGISKFSRLMVPLSNLIDNAIEYLLMNLTSIVSKKRLNLEPAVNVSWYVDVQIFTHFSDYILLLSAFQPLLFSIPLLVRFSNLKPLHTVRTMSS